MRIKFKNIIFLIIILCVFSVNVNAQNATQDKQIVSFNNKTPTNVLQNLHPISYWELPLWVKISCVSISIVSLLLILKYLPLIIGKYKGALKNPKIKYIYNIINMNPGITTSELSKENHINRGTLRYYLNVLFAADKIISKTKGKFKQIFVKFTSTKNIDNDVLKYLRNEKIRPILYFIMEDPGVSNQEISIAFMLNKSTVHDYLTKLVKSKIIYIERDGKFKRCYINPETMNTLKKYRYKNNSTNNQTNNKNQQKS